MQQARIHFSGIVQGVGFRFETCRRARSRGLTGRVKNCPDGSVEAVVEGPRDAISGLCDDLKNRFGASIRSVDITWAEAADQFTDFQITC